MASQAPVYNPLRAHLRHFDGLLKKAKATKDPALYLYKHKARTDLFMLEALTRLYNTRGGNKQAHKWHKHFKKLEDQLGQIDYYDGFLKEFRTRKSVPRPVIAWLTDQKAKQIKALNTLLRKKEWFGKRLKKFDLDKRIDFSKGQTHIRHHIQVELNAIDRLVEKTGAHFTELEAQVHDLRRQCRWQSIYVQALRGMIQLQKPPRKYAWEKTYVTKTAISHPYNKVPKAPKGLLLIHYNAPVFYAFSTYISEIGLIKDDGLRLQLLTKALEKTEKLPQAKAAAKAKKLLGKKQPSLNEVLKRASSVSRRFFIQHKVSKAGLLA